MYCAPSLKSARFPPTDYARKAETGRTSPMKRNQSGANVLFMPKSAIVDRFLSFEALPLLISVIILFVFFGFYEPRFFRMMNLINVLRNSCYLALIASGQMLVLITGGFDISVGAVVAIVSVTTSLTMIEIGNLMPNHVFLAIIGGVGAGVLIASVVGLLNGVCVALLKVNPFIVTLGTMYIASGAAFFTTSGIPVYGMPDAFTPGLSLVRWFGLPVSVYLTAFILLAIWFLLNWTKIGRDIYATGGNIEAARASSIRVSLRTVQAYVFCSILAGITGLLLTARVGSGEAAMGSELIMESIAAAVIGGVSIGGGVGRVEFVALGAIFLCLVTNGMDLMQVNSKLQNIVVGVILIIAVAFDRLRKAHVSK
jgi:ribose transport system permease protein